MIKDAVMNIIDCIWPMIVIVITILSSIRISHIIKHHKKIKIYEELIHLCFIIYILSLFYLVTFQDVNYGTNNFTLFKEMFRYEFGSRLFIKNVLGNILLFVPLGFFISFYTKSKKIFCPLILTFLASLTIEFTQVKIGRVFDVDDIILNGIGGLFGYLFYKFGNQLPKFMRSTWFLNVISIIMVVLFTLYLLFVYGVIDIRLGGYFELL